MSPKQRAPQVEYSEKVAAAICERIASGETLASVCSSPGMPIVQSVRRWVINDKEGFASRYQRAREMQADVFADEIVTLADSVPADNAQIQKRRLQIEARRWLASVLIPRKYASRTVNEVTGANGGPIKTEHHDYAEMKNLSDEDLLTLRDILRRAVAEGEKHHGAGATGGGSPTQH